MAEDQSNLSSFTQIPPELTDLILRRLPLDSLRDLRLCALSVGAFPVHGLLKSMHIPLSLLDICYQKSSRGSRLKAMTGLTHLRLTGLMVPGTNNVNDAVVKPEELLEMQPLMSHHADHLPLLASLEIEDMHLVCAASVAASLRWTCPAVTTLKLSNMFGSESDYLWSALAGARSLRHLIIADSEGNGKSGGDFSGLGCVDQLHSLCLGLCRPNGITVSVSQLTTLTRVRLLFICISTIT